MATYGKFIKMAPVAIVIIAQTKEAPKWYIHDTAMTSHQMCLMICSLGLGTCWIGSFDRKKGEKVLDLKKGEYITTVLPIGYPQSIPSSPKRKNLDDIVSYIE